MIKRMLLLLCLPLLFLTGKVCAQNTALFQMTLDYAIMGFGDEATCGSLFELYALFPTGSRVMASGSLDGIRDGVVWNYPTKTIVYSKDNPITGIATYGKRKRSCNNTAESKETDYSLPGTLDCYDINVGNLFAGYNQESNIHVTIKPVSNVYNLEITTNEVYPNNSNMDYDITAYYTDGSSDQLYAFIWTAPNTSGNTTINKTFNAINSTGKTISTIHISSYTRINGTGVQKVLDLPVNTVPDMPDQVYSGVFSSLGNNSNIKVSYKKVMNQLVYGPVAGSNILPTNSDITLTGPSGIATSQYVWTYSTDDGASWTNYKGGVNPLVISGNSLFGANYLQYLNKLIRVKMFPICAPDRESATVTLDYRLSTPRIVSMTPKNISCTGANDGGFKLTFDRQLYPGETLNVEVKDIAVGTGGTVHNDINAVIAADGTYTWPSGTLSASRYQITVTGGYNGRATYADGVSPTIFTLTEPTQVTFTTPVPVDVKCFGGSDGAINLSANGGAGGYIALYKAVADNTYLTKAFTANTGVISGLPVGDYLVQVKDQNGCPGKLSSGDTETGVSLKQPDAALGIDAISITHPTAYGYTDGSITAYLKGGTPPYNIAWKKADGTVLTPTNVNNGTTISNQPDGDYILTVTDANYNAADTRQGCVLSNTFTLKQPPLLVAGIQIKDSVSCNGKSDGQLTAVVNGGVPYKNPPYYTYEWYQVLNGTNVAIGQTDETAAGLPAGKYLVKAKDANMITVLSASIDLIDPTPLQVQFNNTAATCYDASNGVLEALVSGGTIPYVYQWSNGPQTILNSGLHAGPYTVALTDYHGCTLSGTASIAQPAAPLAIVQPVMTQPLANGYSDGSIKILLQGGTAHADGTYNVSWQKANGTPLGSGTGQVVAAGYENVLSGIPAGDYTVTITDANYTGPAINMKSCTVTASFTLAEPPPLVISISEQHFVSCKGDADGVLSSSFSGGVPPYTFAWYKEGNAIGQTTSTGSGLTTGTYTIIITDANNIHKSSAPFPLAEPDQLQVQLATSPVTCASGQDGEVNTTVSGGTAPYAYEWTNGATTPVISNLTEGSYLVFVKDSRGCQAQNNAAVFIPNGIVIDAGIIPPICAGSCDGAINTQVSGGIPPYTYEWSNGSTASRIDQLCAGQYKLTIQDNNNCKRVQTFNLPDPAPLKVQLGADKTLCNSQVYTINATIADPVASYTWGGDPAFQASTAQVKVSNSGLYWVEVTDGKGCTGRDTVRIQQVQTDIAASFVVSTQVFRNETVSLINISSPLPERTEWEIPDDPNVTVLQNTALLTELRFADTGIYHITLHSYTGECESAYAKDIAVLDAESLPVPGGAKEPFIGTFEVMPNPNSGQFNVHVTLNKAAEIRLRMFNIISNQLVNDRKESAASEFNLPYQLNITAGTYVLLLETPLGTAIRKIIITQ